MSLSASRIVFRFASMSHIRFSSTFAREFKTLLVKQTGATKQVALVQLNRPKAMNALNSQLMTELTEALTALDVDASVRAVVLTGNERAFAAGADIKEMADKQFGEVYNGDFLAGWSKVAKMGKPIIAAVNGYALGGGCEVAMMCDIIYAGEKANFGQPEINIGTIPGAGGTQRLPRAVGKSTAMEMVLTGCKFSAQEALSRGLVSKIYPPGELVARAVELGDKIAEQSPMMVKMAKEAVNASYETPLQHGLQFEQRFFHSTFATKDQKEGMGAFAEKRKPNFTGQ